MGKNKRFPSTVAANPPTSGCCDACGPCNLAFAERYESTFYTGCNWKHDWQMTLHVGGTQLLVLQWAKKSTKCNLLLHPSLGFPATPQRWIIRLRPVMLSTTADWSFRGKGSKWRMDTTENRKSWRGDIHNRVFCQQSQSRQMVSSPQTRAAHASNSSVTQMWSGYYHWTVRIFCIGNTLRRELCCVLLNLSALCFVNQLAKHDAQNCKKPLGSWNFN